jgi:hypothetical protein
MVAIKAIKEVTKGQAAAAPTMGLAAAATTAAVPMDRAEEVRTPPAADMAVVGIANQ